MRLCVLARDKLRRFSRQDAKSQSAWFTLLPGKENRLLSCERVRAQHRFLSPPPGSAEHRRAAEGECDCGKPQHDLSRLRGQRFSVDEDAGNNRNQIR